MLTLNQSASKAFCDNKEELIDKIGKEPSLVIEILQNMKLEGNEPLAARLLYHIKPDYLQNSIVKKVETTLRNRVMLNYETDPDISITRKRKRILHAHSSILALESPYFMRMWKWGGKECKKRKISIEERANPEVYQLARDYLYLSDEKRKEFVPTVDKTLLPELAYLADLWDIKQLKRAIDDELCNSLAELRLRKSEIEDWSSQSLFLPKFTMLLQFIDRRAGEGELEPVIEKMQTPAGAAQFAVHCTPEEIKAFSTLKTEFGRACQILEGAFGKKEWEEAFPVTIKEVPPLPPNIHAILEQKDPWEPDKKLKETCMFFLRPRKVTLHGEDGDKEIMLGFDGVEELAQKATATERRARYFTYPELRSRMNKIPAAKSGWVLMRKEVIPETRELNFQKQQKKLEGTGFGVPKIMDAILLNILTLAKEGTYLYGRNPWTFTRCEEVMYDDCQTLVGGFIDSGLLVNYYHLDYEFTGLSGSWKF